MRSKTWRQVLGALLLLATSCADPAVQRDAGGRDAGGRDAGLHDVQPNDQRTSEGTAGDGPVDAASTDGAATDATPKPTAKILFIGNSYTYVNDLPGTLTKLGAASQSPMAFSVQQHTPGGTRWEEHDTPAVHELIKKGWDTVVLQDQSQQPWLTTTWGIKPALLSLDAEIKKSGAQTLLFMTWSRGATSTPAASARFAMDLSVNNYYERQAGAVGATVAPIGRAWERSLRKHPALTLHAADGSHPNARGTYLAACVLYTTLTQLSPVGLGDGGLSVPANERALLQHVAWETHQARQRATSPELGRWPLSTTVLGHDLVPGATLVLGDRAGPTGQAQAATTFGSDTYAVVPYFPGLNAPQITVAFYAYRADWSTPIANTQTLIGRWVGYQLIQQQTMMMAIVNTVDNPTTPPLETSVASLSPGWHHFALTYDGATYALWIDAQQVASAQATGALRYAYDVPAMQHTAYTGIALGVRTLGDLVGADLQTPSLAFHGALADLRLLDRALSQSELAGL